jgi:hypothetical protein
MRVPLSWLREYAPVPEPVDAADVARRLTAAGLEVETVEQVGHDIRGVVIGQVLTVEELTEFKKPIRYCRVAVSTWPMTTPRMSWPTCSTVSTSRPAAVSRRATSAASTGSGTGAYSRSQESGTRIARSPSRTPC